MSNSFPVKFAASVARRGPVVTGVTNAYRLCDGAGDGLPGVYVDRYGPAVILSVYEDARMDEAAVTVAASAALEILAVQGVEAVYVKPFSRDRSRLGGKAPVETYSPAPRAGRSLPETLTIQEHGVQFEVRPYDGFSTGLFLEHREHRRVLPERSARRVLNLFAYTCGFSVPLAAAGAHVTNVDVSARYLEWGQRNHALNRIDTEHVRYKRMDAMAYLAYAARHPEERFDLVVLDPPSFGAGDRRRAVKPWSATKDYPSLLIAAARVLRPGGAIFAATNSRALAADGALRDLIRSAVGNVRWVRLPPWPPDVRERGRVAAELFTRR